MFSRNFRLSAGGPSVDHEISTSVDKLMPRRMILPQKSGLKSGSLSTTSSAHGVPRGRRLWPGNSVPRRMGNVTRGRRARGPSPGLGSQPASLFVRADDGAWVRGPTWGRIVLAASLVLLVDVNPYFKRIETFYRGETFRRETKLHHRKKCLGGEKKRVIPAENASTSGKATGILSSREKEFPTLERCSRDNLSWTGVHYVMER